MNEQLPDHIGGYQHIELGYAQEGDIWVREGKPYCFVVAPDWGFHSLILEADYLGYRLYRRLPVAKQADAHLRGERSCNGCGQTNKSFIPQDDQSRKQAPMFRGLLGYFPAALFEVATHSYECDKKHNPDSTEGPTWARSKSSDHADCIVRHLIDAGIPGELGRRYHLRAIAWRALALLQEECEAHGSLPGVSSR